ncbi:MAG: dephospho-CoA kinase [Magnetococcales bacterium]|nr:dephospho-CoA kinase [Magnetococcales bacterium]
MCKKDIISTPTPKKRGLFIIGVTGSMGCGKSTVTKLFANMGARLLDADKMAREVVLPGEIGWQEVVEYFGDDILLSSINGKELPYKQRPLNRKKLGEQIFKNPAKRKVLEAIIHPKIVKIKAEILKKWEMELTNGESRIVVMEVPLLFEAGLDKGCNLTIAVVCGDEQLSRLSERKSMSTTTKKAAIAQQLSEAEKKSRADIVIDNSGDLAGTIFQVEKIFKQITKS